MASRTASRGDAALAATALGSSSGAAGRTMGILPPPTHHVLQRGQLRAVVLRTLVRDALHLHGHQQRLAHHLARLHHHAERASERSAA